MRPLFSSMHTFVAGILLLLGILFVGLSLVQHETSAQTADELRAKISASQQQLAEIEKEIKRYESELNQVGAEKQTLQRAINELELARKKIQADVRATEQKINSTDLEITELEREIRIKLLEIERNRDAVADSLRIMDELENETLVELLLSYQSLADVWEAVEAQAMFQAGVHDDIRALAALKDQYEKAMGRSVDKRDELGTLYEELAGEVRAVQQTKEQKDSLLGQTKNKEANYQQILAEKKALYEQFQREMQQYESQLSFILDKSTIPAAGSGALAWPFDVSYMLNCESYVGALGNPRCITQFYGNTAWARQSGVYGGNGHNGIDFRAPTGTRILSALAGTVQEVNHGVAPMCQYGKWVLVKHANGLTTLYAHLSSVAVQKGQQVATGQLVGYSGDTGLAYGPHLHFTVYVSAAVQFKQHTCNSGPTVSVPVSAFSGYLNPLDYL